jgi:hypothetical protein
MIILNIDQRSEAWYEARCGRVTGTRFQKLLSKETTDSYKDLVTNIACEILTGRMDEGYSNALMEEAIEKEPEARKEYEMLFGVKVKEVGFIIPDEETKYHDWIGVSPDGIIEPIEDEINGGLEIKCPLMKTHFEYIMENRMPPEYRFQVQGALFVTGLPHWDFMSYAEGMKPFVIRVMPDKEMFAMFEQRLDKLILDVKERLETYKQYDYLL